MNIPAAVTRGVCARHAWNTEDGVPETYVDMSVSKDERLHNLRLLVKMLTQAVREASAVDDLLTLGIFSNVMSDAFAAAAFESTQRSTVEYP